MKTSETVIAAGDIRGYRKLLVWQKSCLLISKGLKVLRAIRRDFVSEAILGQLVRSLFSIRANIVEGWCGHPGKGFAAFLEISRGSTGETEDWFYSLCEEGYITREVYEEISQDCRELAAMLTSLIKTIRAR